MDVNFNKEISTFYQKGEIDSELTFKIIDIKKYFNEYYLTLLSLDSQYEIAGFYIKPDIKLKLNYIITNIKLVLKKENFRIKIYINEYNIIKNKKEENENNISQNPIKFNIDSDNILSYFINLNLILNKQFIEEEILLIKEISNIIKVQNIIFSQEYIINNKKYKI